jgi:osmoprotectant transport system permease protein
MELLGEVGRWFADPVHWSGPAGIPARLIEHIQISALSVGAGTAIALPVGLFIGHTRRAQFLVVSVANLGRAVPSFAILAIAFPFSIRLGLGLGFWPTVTALFLLAIPPILTNTYVGVQTADPDTVEAARGMGMSGRDVLFKLEIPLAAPLIAAGLRTAFVQVIATATLAALFAWGGLGRFIIDGFATRDEPQIVAGAVLVAVLAVAAELGLGILEKVVSPRTSSTERRKTPKPGVEEVAAGAA